MIGINWDLPFLEQLAFFRSKGIEVSPESWRDVWREAHARAFTVARVTEMDVLGDIRSAIEDAIATRGGMTLKEFKAGLRPTLERKGWLAPEGARDEGRGTTDDGRKRLTGWRLDNIFATNMQDAYSTGRYAQLMEVKERRPYWMYVAVMDSSTRPDHAAMTGKIYHADHPFWDQWYPPNGFRCRCYVRSLSERQMDRLKLREETRGVDLKPDEGFDYNPGKAGLGAWKPDLSKYQDAEEKILLSASRRTKHFWNLALEQDIESFVSARDTLPEWQRAFITPYTAEEYKGMNTFMLADGKAGYAVKTDGELVSVFSRPGAHRGADVVDDAIKNGATKLDCFDGFLPTFYDKFGFEEYKREPWNEEWAPKGWDYKRFGTPDIVYMRMIK